MRIEWKKNWMGMISMVLFGLFPCITIYFHNVTEARFVDVAFVMVIFLVTAGILWFLFSRLLKSVAKGIAITNIAMILLCNFELLADFFGECWYKYYCMIALCVLVLGVLLAWMRYWKEDFLVELNDIFFVVMMVLVAINAFPALPAIANKMIAHYKILPSVSEMQISKVDLETAPNVYYLIFDEYGGAQNLQQQLQYDNSSYMNSLRDRGFNVSDTSYNMEGISTHAIVPNLLNLEYVVEEGSVDQQFYMKNPKLYALMQKMGYDVNTCSHIEFLDNGLSRRAYDSALYYEGFAGYMVLERSAFIHLYNWLIPEERKQSVSYEKTLLDSIEWFMDSIDLAAQAKRPQFYNVYFQAPHNPFLYREDGTSVSSGLWYEYTGENYLPYLEWTNKQIDSMVKHIMEVDPESIIIIQADHGFRYWFLNHLPLDDAELERSNHNILNCVYYKGEELEIEGLSGINTLRKVLNTEFGLDFDMIEYQPGLVD